MCGASEREVQGNLSVTLFQSIASEPYTLYIIQVGKSNMMRTEQTPEWRLQLPKLVENSAQGNRRLVN